jgi:hypothetical protein
MTGSETRLCSFDVTNLAKDRDIIVTGTPSEDPTVVTGFSKIILSKISPSDTSHFTFNPASPISEEGTLRVEARRPDIGCLLIAHEYPYSIRVQ